MNLLPLLNQTTAWRAASSTNDRDDVTYAAPVTLRCRSEAKLRDIIGKDGEVTTATNKLTMLQEVSLGDLLDDRQVIMLDSMVTVGGQVVGWIAYTR